MNFSTPIFGEGGRLEGNLTGEMEDDLVATASPVSIASLPDAAFTAGEPSALYRDRAAELQAREVAGRTQLGQLNPALAAALDVLRRKQTQCRTWEAVVEQKQAEVLRLTTLANRSRLSLSHEDAQAGSRTERLASAQAELRESVEELLASKEELEAAQQRVDSITAVSA